MNKEPTLLHDILLFGTSVTTVVLGLRLGAGMQLAVLLGVVVAAIGAGTMGLRWDRIQSAMFSGVQDGMPAVSILLLVGATIGLWIASGTIPTMIWYGLRWLSPSTVVPATCIITALVSSATGTSFGSIATIGLALMGVGEASGIPAPILAGAVVSGAYFGDKMSPLSDTTNVAPAVSGANLYEHISSMVTTTAPGLVVALIGFWFLGRTAAPQATSVDMIASRTVALQSTFNLGLLTLIPVLVLAVLSVRKVPALPALSASLAVSALVAVVSQGADMRGIAKIASEGFISKTGEPLFDSLLSRGGITGVLPTILLIIAATAMGGILRESGAPNRLVNHILTRVRTAGGLVMSVIATCFLTLLASGNQMLAIILPGQAFRESFPARGLHPRVLSRTLEDAGTLGAPLVPWSTASLFIYGALRVPATEYARYALLNLFVPVIAIIYALTGTFMYKEEQL